MAGMKSLPVCLAIGGSDSCGGAGIQADLATFARSDVKGCSAITALTAQNPDRISRIEPVSLGQLEAELLAIFDYYEVAAVKTGMLVDAAHVHCVAKLMAERHAGKPLVVDAGVVAMTAELLPLATLITPNLPEAARLLRRANGDPVEDAAALAMQCRTAVLLKGGHQDGDTLTDVLVSRDGDIHLFTHPKRQWSMERLHGTGCRLAAAIAAGLAAGREMTDAVSQGIELV